jgi:hypothetical protein
VHASRVVTGFDSRLFVAAADDGALVRGELAALSVNPVALRMPAGEGQPC